MAELESSFQRKLIEELEVLFPGCIVLKNDPTYIQGFPDLTILWGEHWAVLECKRSKDEPYRPNQKYYIKYCNEMSFSRGIYPENKEGVLNDLQRSFKTKRPARVPRGK